MPGFMKIWMMVVEIGEGKFICFWNVVYYFKNKII
jgi:hypothetical protein